MRFEGSFHVGAPVDTVWEYLMQLENLAGCIPGCEQIEVLDQTTFKSLITNKVAFLSVRFDSLTRITEMDPPRSLTAVTHGKDSKTRSEVSLKSGFALEPSDEGTALSYWCEVNLTGKIATFGQSVVRGKAKGVLREFEASLTSRVGQP